MSDADSSKADLEGVGAGLLNGVMVVLLGCALLGFLAWRILAPVPDWMVESGFLDSGPVKLTGGDLLLVTFGLLMIWRGGKFVRKNLTLLRARRS